MDLIQILKVIGDENRLRILNLLKYGELCVCEIERILETNQSNTSRHLNKLSIAELINYEKRALYVYYKINNKTLEEYPFLKVLIEQEFEKISKFQYDIQKLNKYKSSGLTCEDLKEGRVCFNSVKEDL